jgi:hypothetical protein
LSKKIVPRIHFVGSEEAKHRTVSDELTRNRNLIRFNQKGEE